MKLTRQQSLTWGLTGIVILAIWTASREQSPSETGVVMPITHRPSKKFDEVSIDSTNTMVTGAAAKSVAPTFFARDPLLEAQNDPFNGQTFLPAARKESVAPVMIQPPPVAMAPPFPFHYLGRMVNVDGQSMVYLTRGEKILAVEEKTRIDNDYRIDSLSETDIQITYLPLNETKKIQISSAEKNSPTP